MVKSISKGVLCAVVVTLLFILGFALLVQLTGMSNQVITPVMQVVKVVCIFVAVAIAIKPAKSKGWLYGAVVGLLYMVLTFLIFSMIDGQFVIGVKALSDLLFQVLVGVVSAVILRLRNKDVEVA
ncbi:MAG: TIGR04086 family membrane protein [Eubacteriales bacterium]|nr:TIGR04086 family membrane protein [Eubacteriales bacterium]